MAKSTRGTNIPVSINPSFTSPTSPHAGGTDACSGSRTTAAGIANSGTSKAHQHVVEQQQQQQQQHHHQQHHRSFSPKNFTTTTTAAGSCGSSHQHHRGTGDDDASAGNTIRHHCHDSAATGVGTPASLVRNSGMSQRIRDFEEECRDWRRKFFQDSKLGKPTSHMLDHQPRLALDFPEFATETDFPSSNWSSSHMTSEHKIRTNNYRTFIKEDLDGVKKYQIEFQVGDYRPNEITVRTEGNNLIVKGEKQIRGDNQSESKRFDHSLSLPDYVDTRSIKSFITDDGQLVAEFVVVNELFMTDNKSRRQIAVPSTSRQSTRTESRKAYSTTSESTKQEGDAGRRTPTFDSGYTQQPQWMQNDDLHPHRTLERTTVFPSAAGSGREEGFQSKAKELTYKFDMRGFTANDIKVQIVDRTIAINARSKHMAGGQGQREFSKEVILPEGAILSGIHNSLTPDGVLIVTVPLEDAEKTGAASSGWQASNSQNSRIKSTPATQQRSGKPELELNYDLSNFQYHNVQINVANSVLTITAPRVPGSMGSDFHETYNLPAWADTDNIKATMTNHGSITVKVPRRT